MKPLIKIGLLASLPFAIAGCSGQISDDAVQEERKNYENVDAVYKIGDATVVKEFTPETAQNKTCVYVSGRREKSRLQCFDKN